MAALEVQRVPQIHLSASQLGVEQYLRSKNVTPRHARLAIREGALVHQILLAFTPLSAALAQPSHYAASEVPVLVRAASLSFTSVFTSNGHLKVRETEGSAAFSAVDPTDPKPVLLGHVGAHGTCKGEHEKDGQHLTRQREISKPKGSGIDACFASSPHDLEPRPAQTDPKHPPPAAGLGL